MIIQNICNNWLSTKYLETQEEWILDNSWEANMETRGDIFLGAGIST